MSKVAMKWRELLGLSSTIIAATPPSNAMTSTMTEESPSTEPPSNVATPTTTKESTMGMGIDLGTTNTCVTLQGKGRREVIVGEYDKRTYPSTVTYHNNGTWEAGKHEANSCPPGAEVYSSIKRINGRDARDGELETDIDRWRLPFKLNDEGKPTCRVGSDEVYPEEFQSLLLLQAQERVHAATGLTVKRCVIAVPAYFSDGQRRSTLNAAKIAGLDVIRIVNEPTAVAVAQLHDHQKPGKYLVIDIGGGTIDCSKVNLSIVQGEKTFAVESTSGNNALGGNEFTHVLAKLFHRKASNVPFDEILALCEEAKKRRDDPITIRPRGEQYTVSQDRYKASLKPLFTKIRKVIEKAGGMDVLRGVILAGGASYLPHFDNFVREMLGHHTFLPRRPAAEIVAEGAAIMADPNCDIIVTDVLSRSLGIDTQLEDKKKNNIMEVVVEQNAEIPTKRMKNFRAVHEEVTSISLYEGEDDRSSKNNLLGEFIIQVPAGETFVVTVDVSLDAEITVTAQSTKESKNLRVTRKDAGMNDSELQAMREKAQQRFASGLVSRSTTRATKKKRKRK